MKKFMIITVFFFLFTYYFQEIFADNSEIKRLEEELKLAIKDYSELSIEVAFAHEMIGIYLSNQASKGMGLDGELMKIAIEHLEKGLEIRERLDNSPPSTNRSLKRLIAELWEELGNHNKAQIYYEKAGVEVYVLADRAALNGCFGIFIVRELNGKPYKF